MKKFNITGTCIPEKNYTVDISEKLRQIMNMVSEGDYFVINRPRQYGKTTTLSLLRREILKHDEYLPVKLSFEGIGNTPFESQESFCKYFIELLIETLDNKDNNLRNLFYDRIGAVFNFVLLSKTITEIIKRTQKSVVLMIDEVDRSSDNQIFMYFLGMLRDKFLKAREDDDVTFHSVILAGVHDIKTLKLKLRPDEERKYNSPWNIAADFSVDMSFSPTEIGTMLSDYINQTKYSLDVKNISQRIYFWTSGYPFLVSKLCKIIDESILIDRDDKKWYVSDVDKAVSVLLSESNTLFDDLKKT